MELYRKHDEIVRSARGMTPMWSFDGKMDVLKEMGDPKIESSSLRIQIEQLEKEKMVITEQDNRKVNKFLQALLEYVRDSMGKTTAMVTDIEALDKENRALLTDKEKMEQQINELLGNLEELLAENAQMKNQVNNKRERNNNALR